MITAHRYMPIIPTVLINGAEGIGTGWSTSIPNYSPHDIVDNIKRLMNDEEQVRSLIFHKCSTIAFHCCCCECLQMPHTFAIPKIGARWEHSDHNKETEELDGFHAFLS